MTLGITVVSGTYAGPGTPMNFANKGGGGGWHARVATLTGDAAYPSGANGGYPVTASTFGFATQIWGLQQVATSGSDYQTVMFDYGNSTIRVYGSSGSVGNGTTPSEVASGTSLTSQTWRVIVYGM